MPPTPSSKSRAGAGGAGAQTPPSAAIAVSHIASCPPGSTDVGSCRIRLPAAVWSGAGVGYHQPVLVSVPSEGSSGAPYRLLCVAALSDDDASTSTPNTTSRAGSSPSLTAATATVDPTVVVLPPGGSLEGLRARLRRPPAWGAEEGGQAGAGVNAEEVEGGTGAEQCGRAAAVVEACPGCSSIAAVEAASEAEVLLPPDSPLLPAAPYALGPRLWQALVLPGCSLALSDSLAVQVASLLPRRAPGTPLRIVPSTRLTFAAAGDWPQTPGQAQQAQAQEPVQGAGQEAAAVAAEDGETEGAGPGPGSESASRRSKAGAKGGRGGRAQEVGSEDGEGTPGSIVRGTGSSGSRKGGGRTGSKRDEAGAGPPEASAEGGDGTGAECKEGAKAGKSGSKAKSSKAKTKSRSGAGAGGVLQASASAFDALLALGEDD
ncbi:hypothetical protein HYH03_001954 [Edaphochlamys debaryana]|uniref:Uncharacterized protein n=1 Tax=Edaphochlamys debaryana TaxID=47281 RepID=A0A836C4P2_9CHLO|nr:hypothetical protein HYH03_001954 [Edaphochlamys debaryana]|eukprot:KAG2500381.1 hypothetical protein HYH03_001954 [Edaphochlamys debaryana]